MTDRPLHVMVVAGEPSGDALGRQLMVALRTLSARPVEFSGLGGPGMESEGLRSLFPIDDIAVMGFADVVPRLLSLLKRIGQTARHARDVGPDIAVLIDAPSFNHRVARRIKRWANHIPIALYVAPQVWAWRQGRARRIGRFADLILALLPFEPPFFEQFGVRCVFVGHPVVERLSFRGRGAGFRARHGIAADDTVLAVLPGSRHKEVERLLPIFEDVMVALARRRPDLVAVIPTVPHVAERVTGEVAAWPVRTIVVAEPDEKYAAFEAANAALAASGTVSLELTLARTPMVVAYRVDRLTAFLVRRTVKVKYATLTNLILDAPVIPEFIQENCIASEISRGVERLLDDPAARDAQTAAFADVAHAIGQGAEAPSMRAARAILDTIAEPVRDGISAFPPVDTGVSSVR